MARFITKASGITEPLNPEKIERSLKRIGASEHLIAKIIHNVLQAPKIVSTRDIYFYIANYLKEVDRILANRYNLKNALYQLGPEGFLFEKFIAELFRAQQYQAINDQTIPGVCVDHEIDVIAFKNDERLLVECKFHNLAGIHTDVKVALYIKSRFDDVEKSPVTVNGKIGFLNQPWLATNTKFTIDAIKYARCINMGLVGWAYPEKTSIETVVDRYGLYPITCLVSLAGHQKSKLLNQNILLCKQLVGNIEPLLKIGFSREHAQQVEHECRAMSGFAKKNS